mmetsp:Transcript_16776/g.28459  ORF Transcript_16776/g.28459 Transcript_16776/m.28459 type:complete len:322 (+) Transcript_16776:37-1002(+)
MLIGCILLICLLVTPVVWSKWKADNWKFPPDNPDFKEHDKELHSYLSEVASLTQDLEHTGAETFDQHLIGVQSILRRWGSSQDVADAGLFHSIYGTEGFQGFKLPLKHRKRMSELIGARAERLAWIFCMVDRKTVDDTLFIEDYDEYVFTARAELGRFPIKLTGEQEWLDFIELSLADWLEQVEGAATKANPFFQWEQGQAWGYRRVAYHKMAQVLTRRGSEANRKRLTIAQQMLEDVYAAEPEASRAFHQEVTPPITAAAREAQEAIHSAHFLIAIPAAATTTTIDADAIADTDATITGVGTAVDAVAVNANTADGICNT